ncbi:hypothetical protein KY290_025425 [Solanum tuberosum]|uniref:Protein kinase domain-containing protein n=1 Tax=Solanum tuberosum TaxID=4113 RepID=A0ABQ7UWP8_SOLTU|nr:hypothetical protein KY289_024502 [Solanum tuberosum]KAH0755155.1 hypothetical protein KY290_025425 [Solanum tuberosum]
MDLQQKIAASLEYLPEDRRHYALRKKLIPKFTYDPRLGKVFIDQNTGITYVLLEIIGKYVQLRRTHNYNLLDVIYKACYYTSDWIHNDSLLPSGYATVKFIRYGQEIRQSKLAGQSIPNSNIINFDKWLIQRFRQGFCVALPYMSEGSLRYILSTRFHNGLPEDCIAIALKQALLGLFDLHFSGLVHKRFSAGNIYVNFKQRPISNVEIKLGFAATIYDSELESPLSNLELCELYKWAAAPEVFYSKYEEDLSQVPSPLYQDDDAHTVHSDIWLVGVAALELEYGNLRISNREEFEAMIKKIKRSRRLPDKLEDVLEEINVEEGKGKGKMKKAVVYFNDKLKYVKGKRKFSKEFEELVLDCLSSKEPKRPSVGDLLQRPFFLYAKNLKWFQRRVLYAKNPMPYC